MASHFDVIVVGLGAMGSAAAYHLASRGEQVLGLDMHPKGHDLGSSHGDHRIIREAYFEAPEYVPIVQRAYQLWRDLERVSGRDDILTMTGGLMIGPPDSQVVAGALEAARIHQLPYEVLTPAETAERFPGFHLDPDMVSVYEENAGYLQPEYGIDAHLELAARHGATLRHAEEVRSWRAEGEGVKVETADNSYTASKLVLTTGPWAGELLADLGLPLVIWRIVNAYFDVELPQQYLASSCPIYLWDTPLGTYYGFPHLAGVGLKIGRHDTGEETTARTIRREIDEAEIQQLHDMLARYMPGAVGPVLRTITCMYSMTPDENFIIDRHPEYSQVVFGCGFSGHGYKFASAIGEILADLALDQTPASDIEFLSASRFSELLVK